MARLKEILYPFGPSCEPFTPETELTEDQKAWLIESGRCTEDDFGSSEAKTTKAKTQKEK